MADGDEEEEELNRPEVPKRGSITEEAFVAVELKQLESVPTVVADDDDVDEVGIDEIAEPL